MVVVVAVVVVIARRSEDVEQLDPMLECWLDGWRAQRESKPWVARMHRTRGLKEKNTGWSVSNSTLKEEEKSKSKSKRTSSNGGMVSDSLQRQLAGSTGSTGSEDVAKT